MNRATKVFVHSVVNIVLHWRLGQQLFTRMQTLHNRWLFIHDTSAVGYAQLHG